MPGLYLIFLIVDKEKFNPFIALFLNFVLVPLFDDLFPLDVRNPTKEEQKLLRNQLKFKLPIYLALFLDWVFLFNGLHFLTTHTELSLIRVVFIIFGTGTFGSLNINAAHELIHKEDNLIDAFLGNCTLIRNLYIHWAIEHNRGHHKNVATPTDPATAKLG